MPAIIRNSWGAQAIARIAAYGIDTITCAPLDCENAKPCRSRLAGEGVVMGAARLKAAFAGKPAPTGFANIC
jgi:hypothetical protein